MHVSFDLYIVRLGPRDEAGIVLRPFHIQAAHQSQAHHASAAVLLDDLQALHNSRPEICRWPADAPVQFFVWSIEAEVELGGQKVGQDLWICGVAHHKCCHAPPADQLDKLLKVRIKGRLAHEGEGHVHRPARLSQPLQIRGLGSAIAGEKLLLAGEDAVQKCLGLQWCCYRHRIIYRPPAVLTTVVAFQGGRHLHTAVAGDAVEVVLVALVPTAQGAVQPHAGLDGSPADKVVALAGECLIRLIL